MDVVVGHASQSSPLLQLGEQVKLTLEPRKRTTIVFRREVGRKGHAGVEGDQ